MIPDPGPSEVECVLALIRRPERWLRRRNDDAQLLDPTRIEWTTRVELCIPDLSTIQTGADVPVLVLPLLRKTRGGSAGFRVANAAGQVVPHLTLDENVRWTQAILLAAARKHVPGGQLLPRVEGVLRDIGGADVDESTEALRTIMAWALSAVGSGRTAEEPFASILASTVPTDDEAAQAEPLLENEFMVELLGAATGGYYVLVLAENITGADLIFTVTHEDVLERSDDDPGDTVIRFPVGSAKSYHANLTLPSGVTFRLPLDIIGAEDVDWYEAKERRLSLYASMASASARPSWNGVRKGLSLGPGGLMWPTRLLTGGALVVFLAGFGLRIAGAHPLSGSAPLLVAAVSLAAGVALQRYDWKVQWAVSRSALIALLMVMLAAAIGAGALALDWPFHIAVSVNGQHLGWKSVGWAVATLVSIVAAALTLQGWVRDR